MKVPSQVPAWPRVALVLGTAAFLASAQSVIAGERSRPSDSSGPPVRVERTTSGSSSSSGSSASSSSSRSSSGSSPSASSRESGDRSSSSSARAGRTRPSWEGSPSPGRTRVERPRGSGDGHHHRPGTYYGRHSNNYNYYWGWYGGYYWPWWGWNDPYYPYYYHPRYRSYYDRPYYWYETQERSGALDFDVNPEHAEIWVDGQQMGTADDFDGFPSFLWLPEGSYQVVVYLDGYETLVRDYEIRSGVVIDLEDTLQPGDSVPPEEIFERAAPKREQAPRQGSGGRWYWQEDGAEAKAPPAEDAEAYDVRGEPGRVRLVIEPGDASVYLDGRFLGTAEDLGRLRKGLIIDPGEHRLQVVRPGFETVEKTFTVEARDETEVEIVLERE
ncbi:MAG TPA: PEGA domain-containing protein [Thermoanaerobaculia bacterium]|nr:PEGA domain-containing protein [Thermoanaerobaculia bacterium]